MQIVLVVAMNLRLAVTSAVIVVGAVGASVIRTATVRPGRGVATTGSVRRSTAATAATIA